MDAVPCAVEADGDTVVPADAVPCAEADGKEVALVDGVPLCVGTAVWVAVAAAEPVGLAVDDPLPVAGAERVPEAVAVRDKKDAEEVVDMVLHAVAVTVVDAEAVERAVVVAVTDFAEAVAEHVEVAVDFAEAVVVAVEMAVEMAVSVDVLLPVESEVPCNLRTARATPLYLMVGASGARTHHTTCTCKRKNSTIKHQGMQPVAPHRLCTYNVALGFDNHGVWLDISQGQGLVPPA